ncbi:hypothetical protein [Streptomyces sp. NPDC000618]|uniref:hypothetical protein n=1 Tax=Streptomyces sp. NPDC000618 TaxID=3154265 RepID=UPI0033287152
MRRPGPALRVGLLGVAVTLTGYALFAGWLGLHAQRYADARDRATQRIVGVVVEDGIGDEDDIRVRWTDAEDRTHLQRFPVYDTDRYRRGSSFPVAYAPGSAEAFPTDPDETATEDDLIVPIVLGSAAALLILGVWVWRGLRFRLTARRPGRPMTARVRYGRRRTAGPRAPRTTWLELTTPDGTRRLQRVMWHPILDETPADSPVTVHGSPRRPAVVVLPDGTRLVPLGRLGTGPAIGVVLDDEALRADLRDAFVLPVDTAVRPASAPWRRGALTAATGTALGVVAGFVLTGGSLVPAVAVALCAGALLTSTWALSAPQP